LAPSSAAYPTTLDAVEQEAEDADEQRPHGWDVKP
jgi:hypothetical protein